uniref:IBB domain-containing protein n=1 Tax=Parascaris equorum TaxID=6256 RepID=A0A914RXU3_PAREQ
MKAAYYHFILIAAISQERTGISTDDDAMSELKTGRFWSREERKKHLERAKERKMRQHQMLAERQQRPSDQVVSSC